MTANRVPRWLSRSEKTRKNFTYWVHRKSRATWNKPAATLKARKDSSVEIKHHWNKIQLHTAGAVGGFKGRHLPARV